MIPITGLLFSNNASSEASSAVLNSSATNTKTIVKIKITNSKVESLKNSDAISTSMAAKISIFKFLSDFMAFISPSTALLKPS